MIRSWHAWLGPGRSLKNELALPKIYRILSHCNYTLFAQWSDR